MCSGKLRYISGYVIGKEKYHISKKIRRILLVPGTETRLCTLQTQLSLLTSLCLSYDTLIKISTEKES